MKSRKKLKGMTLIEIIISMAVFAVLGVILLGVGRVVDTTTKSANRLNKKMTVQAPYAAAKSVGHLSKDDDGDGVDDGYDYYTDSQGNDIVVNPDDMQIKVYFGSETNPDKVTVPNYEKEADGSIKKDAEGNPIVDPAQPTIQVDAKEILDAKKYSTKGLVENNSLIYSADSPNANLNFQFVTIEP